MKKTLLICLQLLPLIVFAYTNSVYADIIQETFPEAAEIQTVGSYQEYRMFIAVYEPDWAESLCIYNEKTREITECTDITELSVHSARIITAYSRPFIEAIGMTHNGNGSIHLLHFDGTVFFSYLFLDCHYEDMYFDDVKELTVFSHYTPTGEERYSRVISGDTLSIDYTCFDVGIIRIFGTVCYLAVQEYNNTKKVISSIKIERVFRYSDHTDVLSYSDTQLREREYNTQYTLIKKIGIIDNVFGTDF